MSQQNPTTQLQLSQASNNQLTSTIIISILMIICVMLAITSIALRTYQYQQDTVKKYLTDQASILANNTVSIGKQLSREKQSEFVVLSPSSPLPKKIERIMEQRGVAQLSYDTLQQLNLESYGFEKSIFITKVPSETLSLFVATEVPSRALIRLFVYTGLYLSVTILGIMLAYHVFLHNKVKRRLRYINEATHEILSGNLDKRIPINPAINDEYSEVSQTLNTMLDKNAQLMQDLRQVNNNIAHDLKSPLNRMRSRMEVVLLNSRTNDEYEQALSSSIDDIDDLLKTFQSLLLMGNLDSDSRNYQLQRTSLSQLLDKLAELYETVAEEKGHRFQSRIQSDIYCFANSSLFAQAISNLLENAIKYTPSGGKITLSLKQSGASAIITVTDNGLGIPKAKHNEVFERFSRLDSARQLSGTGLGMSLVQSILKVHKANIHLHDNHPGLRVEIRIKRIQH